MSPGWPASPLQVPVPGGVVRYPTTSRTGGNLRNFGPFGRYGSPSAGPVEPNTIATNRVRKRRLRCGAHATSPTLSAPAGTYRSRTRAPDKLRRSDRPGPALVGLRGFQRDRQEPRSLHHFIDQCREGTRGGPKLLREATQVGER